MGFGIFGYFNPTRVRLECVRVTAMGHRRGKTGHLDIYGPLPIPFDWLASTALAPIELVLDVGHGDSTMTTDSAEKLLVEGVQELYYAEQQLVDATETLADQTNDESASQAFAEHHDETQTHVKRLEQVFEQIGEEPQTREEQVVDALIDEHEQFAQENEGDTLDRYNIAVGQKTEHYEIAAYGNITSLASKLGHEEAADLLEENLREEQEALDKLSQVGEQFDEQYVAGD